MNGFCAGMLKVRLRGVIGGDSCHEVVPEVVREWLVGALCSFSGSDALSLIRKLGVGGASFSFSMGTGGGGIVEGAQKTALNVMCRERAFQNPNQNWLIIRAFLTAVITSPSIQFAPVQNLSVPAAL